MFNGRVRAEWLDDGRNMRLLESLTFTDSTGKIWSALPGSIINGASIPKILWSILGSPYVGLYRRAAVIHDVHCSLKVEPYQAVHIVFNEMMAFDHVKDLLRTRMFKAVWYFGPKWVSSLFCTTPYYSELLPADPTEALEALDAKPWPL
jgi:hypothetical protein